MGAHERAGARGPTGGYPGPTGNLSPMGDDQPTADQPTADQPTGGDRPTPDLPPDNRYPPVGFVPGNPGHDAVMRMMRDDIASNHLGIELVEVGDGTATVTMAVTDWMVNGHAIGHGGYVFLVADTAFACACNSHGPVTVAAHAEITFVRPVKAGDVLTARATERQRFGRSGVYDVTVSTGAGVVAEFRGLSRTIQGTRLV